MFLFTLFICCLFWYSLYLLLIHIMCLLSLMSYVGELLVLLTNPYSVKIYNVDGTMGLRLGVEGYSVVCRLADPVAYSR